MIEGPLYQNPLAGGALLGPQENELQGDALVKQMQMRMTQRDKKTPAFLAFFEDVMNTKGYPNKTMQDYESQFPNLLTERIVTQEDGMNLSGSNVPLNMFNVTPPSVPVSEQTPISGLPDLLRNPVRPKSDDPIRQGFFDSEFFKPNAPTTMDVVNYTYQGKPMTGSSSNISQFQQYLDSIGKGDLIQRNDEISSQGSGPLATVSGPNDSLDLFAGRPVLTGNEERISGVGQDIFGNNPAEIPVPSAPQNNQFQGFNDRLTKIEEGVASLLQNRGQQFNFGMQPRFDFGMQPRFNISGLGYFFNPQGGFYG